MNIIKNRKSIEYNWLFGKTYLLICLIPILFLNFIDQPYYQSEAAKLPKSIKVGFSIARPSAYLDENDNPVGFFMDIFKHIVDKENINVEYITDSFSNLLDKIKNGEIDALLNMTRSDERDEFLIFSKENMLTGWRA